MAKKVTAPKTHKPSGNRPLEHLAYLNRREMDYLRALNGGYMERGPRGLPSFAEETVGPGGGNLGGGGKGPSSSAGTSTSGSSSRSGTTTSSSATSTPKSQTFSRSDVMMTDANGVQYDYNGNAIKSAATPQKSSSTASQSGFSNFRYGSGENIDKKIQSAAQVSGTVKAAANSPAVKSDLASGGIKSLNVGPMGTRVSVGSISKTATTPSGFSGPSSFSAPPARISSSPVPSAKIGMSAPRGFYDGITTEQESALRGLQQQAERQSLGLVGKSASDPRSTISTPANRPMSAEQRMGFTEALKRAGVTAFNAMSHPMQTAGSLVAGAATSAANDIKNTMQSISAATDPRINMMPGVKEAAVENAFNTALNYGVLGGVAGSATVPTNSVGMWTGRMSSDPAVQKALDFAEQLKAKGARPEDIFNETVRNSPSYMSGVMTLPFSGQKMMVELNENLRLNPTNPVDVVMRTLTGDPRNLGSVIKANSPVLKSYPELANMPVGGSLLDIVERDPTGAGVLRGAYTPGYNTQSTGMSMSKPTVLQEKIRVNYPQSDSLLSKAMINAKALANRDVGDFITKSNFRDTLAHELAHAVAQREGFPPGSNPGAIALNISQSNPNMTQKDIQDLAWSLYENSPGEFYARFTSQRLGLPSEVKRDYSTSFVRSIPQEDFMKMYKTRSWANKQWQP